MRDVFALVPPPLRESAYALGSTRWEVVRSVVLPYTRTAVVGGIFLGLGRALGETMAVTFVLGNAHDFTISLLMPGNSIAAAIANEFTEADCDIYRSSLIALGFLLFVVTFVVLAAREADAAAAGAAGGAHEHERSSRRDCTGVGTPAQAARPGGCSPPLATLFGLFWLVWILWTTLVNGFGALEPRSCSPR